MNMKYKGFPEADRSIVYVRPVLVADLPEDMQAQIDGLATVYSVHRPDGEQVALVANRKLAFHLAREHEMTPVSVH